MNLIPGGPASLPPEEEALRPIYSRLLRLRQLDPGGLLCFAFFEGTLAVALLLALAELVPWWGVPGMPVLVAVMVKANDLVAGVVARRAARVPQMERERFQRDLRPAVGRAVVPGASTGRRIQPATGPGRLSGAATRGAVPEALTGMIVRPAWRPAVERSRNLRWSLWQPSILPVRRPDRQAARRRYR